MENKPPPPPRPSLKRHAGITGITIFEKDNKTRRGDTLWGTSLYDVPQTTNKRELKMSPYGHYNYFHRWQRKNGRIPSKNKKIEICNQSFITGIQQMQRIKLEQLTDRISSHNTDPEITIFETFLRNMDFLLNSILLFIQTRGKNCRENNECTKLI